MNKARRHELKMLKYKKRLKKWSLKEGKDSNLFAFRSHGAPCSCYMCSHSKFNRAKQKAIIEGYDKSPDPNMDKIYVPANLKPLDEVAAPLDYNIDDIN